MPAIDIKWNTVGASTHLHWIHSYLAVCRISSYNCRQTPILFTGMIRLLFFSGHIDISRLDGFIKRCKRYGYCPDNFLKISELFTDADDQLFSRVLYTPAHVLKPLLPSHKQHDYNLRDRSHNFELINKNAHLNDRQLLFGNCTKTRIDC